MKSSSTQQQQQPPQSPPATDKKSTEKSTSASTSAPAPPPQNAEKKKKGMFGRRTWNEQLYAQRALERKQHQSDHFENIDEHERKRAKLMHVSMRESERKPLQARSQIIDSHETLLRQSVGEINDEKDTSTTGQKMKNLLSREHAGESVISRRKMTSMTLGSSSSDENVSVAGAFFCHLCQVSLKDSLSYVDHLNSRQHTSAMGMGMRAQRATLDAVLKKLDQPPLPNRRRRKRTTNS